MVSIIICSRSKALAEQISENIRDTVGIVHEIIILDNSELNYPIGVQYNIGATRAKYDSLLFVHEDITIMTNDWGKVLIDVLANKEIAMAGLTGSTYYPGCPGTWPNDTKLTRENIYHKGHHFYQNPLNEKLSDVVTLDGVFLACRKEVWNAYKFNEDLKGFHFYDLDLCFRILTTSNLKLVITYGVSIDHFSAGKLDMEWIDQSINFYNNWKSNLPLSVVKVSKVDEKRILKNKLEQFLLLFYFKYNGTKRWWLLNFYLARFNILGLSKSLIFVIRYVLFGSDQSAINQKLADIFKNNF